MEKKGSMFSHVSIGLGEIEGARRATAISPSSQTSGLAGLAVVPDAEVPEKALRRKYTAKYKRRIIQEAELCKDTGQIGALLRREGLYSSNLTTWRRQAEQGTLEALSPKKRGPKEKKTDPSMHRIAELEKEKQKLEHKLRQAELIIAAQKKIAEIFQDSLDAKEEMKS